MSPNIVLFLTALCITVTFARVTFTHSEVLQETDLVDNKAKFKCDNGCYVYSDSASDVVFISDGKQDVTNFVVFGGYRGDGAAARGELVPWDNYYLEVRGNMEPVKFTFYVVDKKAPYIDTLVRVLNSEPTDMLVSGHQRFTVISSYYSIRAYTFQGTFPQGYPRIYTTGFDATSESECRPVYTARSLESAVNSWISIPSPIATIDLGDTITSANVKQNRNQNNVSKAAAKKYSTIYMSPGYVGCSYIKNQLYSSGPRTVLNTFDAESKSLDMEADFSLPPANDAVHITVNDEKVDLVNEGWYKNHWDADNFFVTISWYGNTAYSNFALQFDFGIGQGENGQRSTKANGNGLTTDATASSTTSPIAPSTTSSASAVNLFLSLITLAFLALMT